MRPREAGVQSKRPQEGILLCRYGQHQVVDNHLNQHQIVNLILNDHMKACCQVCPFSEPSSLGASGSPDASSLRVMVFPTHYAFSGGVIAPGRLYENNSGYSHSTFPISHFLKRIINQALTPDI